MTKQPRGIVPRKIKGFRDIDPGLNALRWHIIDTARKVYQAYGFEHWDTPVLEYADTLGKYMPDADSVEQGVYAFPNPEEEPVLLPNGQEMRDEFGQVVMTHHPLALRYDLTAPLARLYAEGLWMDYLKNRLEAGRTPLFRRFQFGPVFRYEVKLTPGRFREFWQLDFDTVGSDDVATDAEACMILCEALEAIGLPPDSFIVRVNNRKILKGFLQENGVQEEDQEQAILRVIDKLDKVGWEAVLLELGPGRTDSSGAEIPGLGLPEELIDRMAAFIKGLPREAPRSEVLAHLDGLGLQNPIAREGIAELEKIDALLSAQGFGSERVMFDLSLVRGMAYYTGPVFEVESLQTFKDAKGRERKVGSICGGGRYDGLVEQLLNIQVPATGASIGVDRLAELLRLTQQQYAEATGPVLIAYFDDELAGEYQNIARDLRRAGIPAEVYYGFYKGFRKLKKQLKYADEKNCPLVVLLGSDEAAQGIVTVKNLRLGAHLAGQIEDKREFNRRVQTQVPRQELVAFIRENWNAPLE